MKAKVGVVRGSTENEVKSKKYDIYVGISLGNKWFTKDNIREQLKWILQYTKNRAGLLIGDTLQAINYQVKQDITIEKARKRALKEGDKMIVILKEIIKELPKEEQKRVDIIRWDDVKRQSYYENDISLITQEFNKNTEFRETIMKIVSKHLQNSWLKYDETKKIELCRYIIDEFPELLQGCLFNGITYNCYTYPEDNLLTQLMGDIWDKTRFSYLHDLIDIKPVVYVELKVE